MQFDNTQTKSVIFSTFKCISQTRRFSIQFVCIQRGQIFYRKMNPNELCYDSFLGDGVGDAVNQNFLFFVYILHLCIFNKIRDI